MAPVKLVGALSGKAAKLTPFRVQEYVYGAVPPLTETIAEPVAVFQHGLSSIVNDTAVIAGPGHCEKALKLGTTIKDKNESATKA